MRSDAEDGGQRVGPFDSFQFFEREIALRPDPDSALCGSKMKIFSMPAQFLTRIAGTIFKNPESFGEWSAKQDQQFQTLTHPSRV
ncbi:MAG: hypothetical protein ABSB84_16130 [Verrucomicrobiota bacterium]